MCVTYVRHGWWTFSGISKFKKKTRTNGSHSMALILFWVGIDRSGHSNHGATNRSSADGSGGSGGAGSHASDPASLLDALGGESLTEKERRLSETIAELQKLREQMIAQRSGSSSSDYADRVSPPWSSSRYKALGHWRWNQRFSFFFLRKHCPCVQSIYTRFVAKM